MAGSAPTPSLQTAATSTDRPPSADDTVEIGLDMQAPLAGVVVNIDGLQKVRPSSLQKEFASLEASETVGELLQRLEATHHRLEDLRLFQAAVSEVHCGPRPGEVSVNFVLKEKAASYLFGTYVNSRGDVELEANAEVPAFLGGTQTFSLTGGVTPVSSTSQLKLSADLAFPRLPCLPLFTRLCPVASQRPRGGEAAALAKKPPGLDRATAEGGEKSAGGSARGCHAGVFSSGLLRAFSTQTSWAAASSFFLQQTGVGAQVFSGDGRHTLAWETCMRDIVPACDASRMASPSILRTPLRSLKHGLRYDFTLDRLDKADSRLSTRRADPPAQGNSASEGGASAGVDPREKVADAGLFPRSGYVVNAGAEVALPGGDTRFFKAHFQGFAAAPLPLTMFSLSRDKARLAAAGARDEGETVASTEQEENQEKKTTHTPWVLSGRIGCGFLVPGGSGGASICDKFRLTGPYGAGAALRGFRSYAVGPSDVCHIQDPTTKRWRPAVDYLGGDSFLASEVSLSYDLRFPSSWRTSSSVPPSVGDQRAASSTPPASPFHPRAFLFGSVATLGDVFSATRSPSSVDGSAAKDVFLRFTELLRNWRGTVGWGLALPVYRGVWLEGVVALPVRKQKNDEVQRFQLGLRLSSGRLPE
ncbi:outer membrane, OMP85 family protein [Toxoplasma gondii MAS]|uniref:Outer membrane, OMP85 family protein n=2 Tax=Toxoplasma gondii TaxID=5811 RepID=A0A086Q4R9_TOXGO|nr:outer membrane, OMP85 family protein [Toxoplasma gondii MAS]PUA85643.1 outer membrane, OMP85 family protein [Toxoplasma gondii TgCATBr9]